MSLFPPVLEDVVDFCQDKRLKAQVRNTDDCKKGGKSNWYKDNRLNSLLPVIS